MRSITVDGTRREKRKRKSREGTPDLRQTQMVISGCFLGDLNFNRLFGGAEYQTVLAFVHIGDDMGITRERPAEQAQGQRGFEILLQCTAQGAGTESRILASIYQLLVGYVILPSG